MLKKSILQACQGQVIFAQGKVITNYIDCAEEMRIEIFSINEKISTLNQFNLIPFLIINYLGNSQINIFYHYICVASNILTKYEINSRGITSLLEKGYLVKIKDLIKKTLS